MTSGSPRLIYNHEWSELGPSQSSIIAVTAERRDIMATTQHKPWTIEEFLAWESRLEERYEYLPGHMVVAMVGGTFAHNVVAANLVIELGNKLPTGCRVVSQGMRLRIDTADAVVYPDVMVVCGDADASPSDTERTRADLVVEVLSPGTADHDRGRKWDAYQCMDGLRAYLLVDPVEETAALYARTETGWGFTSHGADAEIELPLCADPVYVSLARIWYR